MLYGGNAHTNSGAQGPECDFMFPGNSDPCNWGTGGTPPNGGLNQNGNYWTEETVGNQPNDRRFMQSAGPLNWNLVLLTILLLYSWARLKWWPWASVELLEWLMIMPSLFDNCFDLLMVLTHLILL